MDENYEIGEGTIKGLLKAAENHITGGCTDTQFRMDLQYIVDRAYKAGLAQWKDQAKLAFNGFLDGLFT